MVTDEQEVTNTAVTPLPSTTKNHVSDDDSAEEGQLKIVEEEAAGSVSAPLNTSNPNDGDSFNDDTAIKPHASSNNNELASPSTISAKAGCSKTGGGTKSVQPNFDFDYDGPPVVVSNGMALELVNRFGLNNAWGAFLKLKGYHTPYDKNAPQSPEHTQALKRFRRKIRTVREMFNALRDKNEDTNPLMSKEFIILLKTGENGGVGGDGTIESQVPTSTTPEVVSPSGKEKKFRGGSVKTKMTEETLSTTVTQPISVQIDTDATASNNGAVPADPTQPKRPRKSLKKELKRGSLATNTCTFSVPDSVITTQTATTSLASADAANQSKIDEIVTNVIERVMASNTQTTNNSSQQMSVTTTISSTNQQNALVNRPLETPEQMSLQTPLPPGVQMQPALLGLSSMEQLQELYRINPNLFNTFSAAQPTSMHASATNAGVQSLLSTVKSSAALNSSVTAPLTLNTSHTNPAAKFLLQGQGAPQQTPHAFLDSGTAQLFFPPQTPQHSQAISNFGVPFLNAANPVAAIRAALQHQQQGQLPAMFSGVTLPPTHALGPGMQVGAPTHWPLTAASQFDPAVSAQLSIQHLAASTSQKLPQSSAQTNPDKPLTVDVAPDEDEDVDQINVETSPNVKVQSKITKDTFDVKADTKQRKQSKSSTLSTPTTSVKQSSPKVSVSKERKLDAKTNAVPAPTTSKKQAKSDVDELVVELREQIEQLESQLNAERTKFSVQKRRMDMMRDKLKKKDDELQTARIDYACQKTDNAALKQEIEALKAENNEFRACLKDSSLAASVTADEPTTSRQANSTRKSSRVSTRRQKASDTPAIVSAKLELPEAIEKSVTPEKPQRKRKKTAAATVKEETPDLSTTVEQDEIEGERRQSKRLRGARSRVSHLSYS